MISFAVPSRIQRVAIATVSGTDICTVARSALVNRAAAPRSGVTSSDVRSPGARLFERLSAR